MNRLPLRERNRQRNGQRIVDAAFALFHTTGYTQTTMDAIAEKAEVSRATLFNYFPTKQALLMQLTSTLYREHVQPEIQSYLDTQPGTVQALHRLFMSIHEHILMVPDLYRALQEEFFHHEPGGEKDAGTGFLETLLAILASGKRRGELRSDLPLEKLAHYIGALYVSVLFLPLERQVEPGVLTHYRAEIDTLLAFLDTALNPGVSQRNEKDKIDDR
ncbi:TetR family transcriptional regulator [Ktedonobacteria bacterium brp13]|nr:TetR family transcriptional regulator [Ktedonobacteria bacterium brp13]